MRNGSTGPRWKRHCAAIPMPRSERRRATLSPIVCSTPGWRSDRSAFEQAECLEALVGGLAQHLHEARRLLHQARLVETSERAGLDRSLSLFGFVLGRG